MYTPVEYASTCIPKVLVTIVRIPRFNGIRLFEICAGRISMS